MARCDQWLSLATNMNKVQSQCSYKQSIQPQHKQSSSTTSIPVQTKYSLNTRINKYNLNIHFVQSTSNRVGKFWFNIEIPNDRTNRCWVFLSGLTLKILETIPTTYYSTGKCSWSTDSHTFDIQSRWKAPKPDIYFFLTRSLRIYLKMWIWISQTRCLW